MWIKITIIYILHSVIISGQHQKESALELVHVIFRHGSRTPEMDIRYPKDPYLNFSYPEGEGQITNAGKRKLYSLGKVLRERYQNFFGDYNSDIVECRSTGMARTKVSAQLVLASLFPPENEFVWLENFNWQPIPYNYIDIEKDHLLGSPFKNCPRYVQLYLNFLNSDESLQRFYKYNKTFDYIKEHTGINITSKKLFNLFFLLHIENFHFRSNELNVMKDLEKLVYLEYKARTGTPELKRLASGFLIKKIIDDTKKKIEKKLPANRKLFLYSAHEFNITNLMQVLGIYYPHIPPYAAYFVVEIHNVAGVRKVKIFYQDYSGPNPKILELPECEQLCPFEKFVELYQQYLTDDQNECNSKQ